MADPFVAEIRITAFNFAPKGWAFCNGQLLPISQNTALFSLLGTFYGGDGKTTFALPNLQGAAPLHQGQGQGATYFLGQQGGSDTTSLLASEMPSHTHTLNADTSDNADVGIPSPTAAFAPSIGGTLYQSAANATLAVQATGVAGGSQPHNNLMPYLTLNFVIALQGVFPPRS
ncbi:MAG: tail collar protein [Frankiales bacterium]|nr:tail collar protein [Frankiales bacterium]